MTVMTMASTTTQDTLATVASRNIRTLMAVRGISQVQLANRLGVSQTAVSKRLRGITPFDLNDLEQYAGILGVQPIDLLDAELLGPKATGLLRDANRRYTDDLGAGGLRFLTPDGGNWHLSAVPPLLVAG